MIFLHGAGERGSDNKSQLVHGSSLFKSDDFKKKHPSIVIFPQCPAKSSWANVKRNDEILTGKKFDFIKEISENKQLIMVEKLLDFIQKKYNIDSSRRYVGLSLIHI